MLGNSNRSTPASLLLFPFFPRLATPPHPHPLRFAVDSQEAEAAVEVAEVGWRGHLQSNRGGGGRRINACTAVEKVRPAGGPERRLGSGGERESPPGS